DALAWHREQADECQAAQPPEWFGVAFHVSRLMAADPANWQWHARRAQAQAELAEWPQVLEDSTNAIARGGEEPSLWHLQALARLERADLVGYRQSWTDMWQRFAQTKSPEQANSVAWVCALAPAALADLAPAISLATKAMKSATSDHARSNFHNTLGALLC